MITIDTYKIKTEKFINIIWCTSVSNWRYRDRKPCGTKRTSTN